MKTETDEKIMIPNNLFLQKQQKQIQDSNRYSSINGLLTP
jgi:hypothetical protein